MAARSSFGPPFVQRSEDGYISRPQRDLPVISGQLKVYQAENGFFPSTEQGLAALVSRPIEKPQPIHWRQLLTRVPSDPWGNEYVYKFPARRSQEPFDLFSSGPDRAPNTADDIGNWSSNPR